MRIFRSYKQSKAFNTQDWILIANGCILYATSIISLIKSTEKTENYLNNQVNIQIAPLTLEMSSEIKSKVKSVIVDFGLSELKGPIKSNEDKVEYLLEKLSPDARALSYAILKETPGYKYNFKKFSDALILAINIDTPT